MRLGVLDVGSNTVHFVVVDAHRGGHPTPMNDSKTRLRLIQYLDEKNNISKTGITRLIDAVAEAADLAKAAKCKRSWRWPPPRCATRPTRTRCWRGSPRTGSSCGALR